MSKLQKYFPNHGKTMKFPWSIYHRPLKQDLLEFLRANGTQDTKLLVIGPGAFEEFYEVKTYVGSIAVLDIDPRVLEGLKAVYGNEISGYHLTDENFAGYPTGFDLIVGKEVIEHISATQTFLQKLHGILNSGGKLWLSTPNYGFFLLPLIERTFLELVARLQGYSRQDIHPVKFSSLTLQNQFPSSHWETLMLKEHFLKLSLSIWVKRK